MISLDHNAGAPLDPRVRDEMLALGPGADGNPNSAHELGRLARSMLESARERIAQALDVDADEIVFTSGGSEANNLALHSGCEFIASRSGEFWISPVEHPSVAVLQRAELERHSVMPRKLHCGEDGRVQIPRSADAPSFLSLVFAQGETGVLQDVPIAARVLHAVDGLLHSDASQALGRVSLSALADCDYVTLSPHKAGGPKGIGILVAKRGCPFSPILLGGEQELGRRPGTQCPRLAVGAAKAIELGVLEQSARSARMRERLARFMQGVGEEKFRVLGEASARLPNTATLLLPGVPAQRLLPALDLAGVLVSYGSACSSGARETSPALLAMGLTNDEAKCCIRVSISHEISSKKIDEAAALFCQVLARIRRA